MFLILLTVGFQCTPWSSWSFGARYLLAFTLRIISGNNYVINAGRVVNSHPHTSKVCSPPFMVLHCGYCVAFRLFHCYYGECRWEQEEDKILSVWKWFASQGSKQRPSLGEFFKQNTRQCSNQPLRRLVTHEHCCLTHVCAEVGVGS